MHSGRQFPWPKVDRSAKLKKHEEQVLADPVFCFRRFIQINLAPEKIRQQFRSQQVKLEFFATEEGY